MRRTAGAIGVAVVMAVLPVAPAHAGIAATGSVDVRQTYRGVSGTVYTFTINNTSTLPTDIINSIEISRPSNAWTITGCPAAPAGWARAFATGGGGSCTFTAATALNGIPQGGSQSGFQVTASAAAGSTNVSAAGWSVQADLDLGAVTGGNRTPVGEASLGSMSTAINVFRVTDAVVQTTATAVGAACPTGTKTAAAGSSQTILVCGNNHGSSALTPVSGSSSLSGTFVSSPGAFGSGSIAGGANGVVLARYTGATIATTEGPGLTLTAAVGSSATATSPLTTLTGYATPVNAAPSCSAGSGSTPEETALTGAVSCTDGEGGLLTYSKVAGPANGTVTVNSDGTFTYTPTANY
ncbi:MAG: Ig-like domain-containing protein, partial [Actinomycetota bacterium]